MNNTLAAQAQNIFVKHTIVLFVAVLFIIMIEELPLTSDPNFSIFKIIFEIVSAYGTTRPTTNDTTHATYIDGFRASGSVAGVWGQAVLVFRGLP
jgi:Trk-type K+ transport system membrane component